MPLGLAESTLACGIELPLTAVAIGAWVRKASKRTLRLLVFEHLLVVLVGWQLRPSAVRTLWACAVLLH